MEKQTNGVDKQEFRSNENKSKAFWNKFYIFIRDSLVQTLPNLIFVLPTCSISMNLHQYWRWHAEMEIWL